MEKGDYVREIFLENHWKAVSPSPRWWVSIPHFKPNVMGLPWDHSGSLMCVPRSCGLKTDSLHRTSACRRSDSTPLHTANLRGAKDASVSSRSDVGTRKREPASSSLPPIHGATSVYVRGVGAGVEHCPCAWMNLDPVELRLLFMGSARAFSSIWSWPSEK